MKKKYIFFLIFFLFSLNVWKWWPGEDGGAITLNGKTDELEYVDLKLPETIYVIDVSGIAARDIFSYKKNNTKPIDSANKELTEGADKSIKKTQKSMINMSQKSKKSGPLKLVGVLIKERNRHAFIVSGDKKRSLTEGEVFDGAYKINAIREHSVTLYNLKSNDIIELKL